MYDFMLLFTEIMEFQGNITILEEDILTKITNYIPAIQSHT